MLGDVSWTFILSAQDDGPEPDCWGSVSVSGFIGLIDCLSFIFIYLHLGEGEFVARALSKSCGQWQKTASGLAQNRPGGVWYKVGA